MWNYTYIFQYAQSVTRKLLKIDSYFVQTRSQARSSAIKLPEVSCLRKNLDPNMKLEKQHANPIKGSVVRLHTGQSRAGLKSNRSDPINQIIKQPSELSQKIPGKTKIETGKTNEAHSKDPMCIINNAGAGMTYTKPLIPDVPFHPGPTYRPLPNPLDETCLEVRKVHTVHQV